MPYICTSMQVGPICYILYWILMTWYLDVAIRHWYCLHFDKAGRCVRSVNILNLSCKLWVIHPSPGNCYFHKLTYSHTQTYSHTNRGLTQWGRVVHICVSKLITVSSDKGLSPGWCQAIIWTSAGMFLIGPLGTNFSEILIEIDIFSVKEMHLKMSSGKWWPFCLGLNLLKSPVDIQVSKIIQSYFFFIQQ